MRNFSCDSAARRCAPVEAGTFPGRLRRCKAHSATPCTPCTSNPTRDYLPHELAPSTASPQKRFITCHPNRGVPQTTNRSPLQTLRRTPKNQSPKNRYLYIVSIDPDTITQCRPTAIPESLPLRIRSISNGTKTEPDATSQQVTVP